MSPLPNAPSIPPHQFPKEPIRRPINSVFGAPNLADEIVRELDRPARAQLARVSKRWHDIANKWVWEELQDIEPLIKLFPLKETKKLELVRVWAICSQCRS